MQSRLNWYYQQVLKISFIIDFVKNNNERMIIWDSDTIILKKIDFFGRDFSIKYATINEFFKAYYLTNKTISKIILFIIFKQKHLKKHTRRK